MLINEIMKENNISKYKLAKNSGVPFSTISDICSGKASLPRCSAETVYKIAKTLDITVEILLESSEKNRTNFELFKSNICHHVKEVGDVDFIIETLEKDTIYEYYRKRWYPETLYLLAMLDYISRLNQVGLCSRYDELRKLKLKEALYPAGINAIAKVTEDEDIKKRAKQEAIPEFVRFNIIEQEVRNVI